MSPSSDASPSAASPPLLQLHQQPHVILSPPPLHTTLYLKTPWKGSGSSVSSSSGGRSYDNNSPMGSPVSRQHTDAILEAIQDNSAPDATTNKRQSFTQQLIKKFSFSSLAKSVKGTVNEGKLADDSASTNSSSTTPSTQQLKNRRDKFNALHTWTPDRMLAHHYRDAENSLWVRYIHDEDEEDDDDVPSSSRSSIMSPWKQSKRSYDSAIASAYRTDTTSPDEDDAEIYIKHDSPTHFFIRVLKKEEAMDEDGKLLHYSWTIDRIADEDEWINIDMRVKEWSKSPQCAKLTALLKLVHEERSSREEYKLNPPRTSLLARTLISTTTDNQQPNATRRRSSSIGSTTTPRTTMHPQSNMVQHFKKFLSTHHKDLYKSIETKLRAFKNNFIILRGAQPDGIAKKIHDFHQKFLNDALRATRLRSTRAHSDTQDDTLLDTKLIFEGEGEEDFRACCEYLILLTGSYIEQELYQKVYPPVWEVQFREADRSFVSHCRNIENYSLTQLGLEHNDLELFECEHEDAVHMLQALDSAHSAYQKIITIKKILDSIMTQLEQNQYTVIQRRRVQSKQPVGQEHLKPQPIATDDVIPIVCSVLLKAKPQHMRSNLSYAELLAPEEPELMELLYVLSTFSAAVQHIEHLSTEKRSVSNGTKENHNTPTPKEPAPTKHLLQRRKIQESPSFSPASDTSLVSNKRPVSISLNDKSKRWSVHSAMFQQSDSDEFDTDSSDGE